MIQLMIQTLSLSSLIIKQELNSLSFVPLFFYVLIAIEELFFDMNVSWL